MNSAAGIRVLVVEDEPIVAMLAEDLLDSIGCVVAATAASVADAQVAIEAGGFDVVMLDVNLDGEDGLALAPLLKAHRIPYLITSGYGGEAMARTHPDAPVLAKPYGLADLEAALFRCVRRP
jgi:CheY-like chemotaxis protein